MLTIEKGDDTRLPKKYHWINNICAYLYDHLSEIVGDFYYLQMAETDLRPPLPEQPGGDTREHIEYMLETLAAQERSDEVDTIIVKHLVMSLIGDMANFIYESIRIAQSGKMSVAYALMRKPFTDQLLIMEQILVDRRDFIDRFYRSGDPRKYDPSDRTIDKKQIIDQAVKAINGIGIYQADLLHQLRFDRAAHFGINGVTNQALHIVTNQKEYSTPQRDLNFIFGMADRVDDYWQHYYFVMPMLLTYSAEVVDHIVFSLIDDPEGRRERKGLQRMLAFAMVFNEPKDKATHQMLRTLGKALAMDCPICKKRNIFNKSALYDFFYDNAFTCKKCHNPLALDEAARDKLSKMLYKNKAQKASDPSTEAKKNS